MTKLEKMQADFRAIEAKAKPLHEKEELTEAEGTELNGYLDQMEALKAKMEQEIRARAAFSTPGIPAERVQLVQDDADKPFESLGEYLQAIAIAAMPPGERIAGKPTGVKDRRLISRMSPEFRAASGMNEAVPAEGGFVVDKDWSQTLIQKAHETGKLPGMCRTIPIGEGSNGLRAPYIKESSRATGSRLGGVRVYRKNEAVAGTHAAPEFGKFELDLEDMIGLCYASNDLVQDKTALGAIIEQGFAQEFGFKMDDEIVRGTGVGQCLGFLTAGCLTTITKETGQTKDTIVIQNILKMWARRWIGGRNYVWLINQECNPQLDQLALPVGTGGLPVYMPAGGISGQQYGTIKGRPVIEIEQASALGDAGDISLVDLSEYVLIDKGGVQAAQSLHVLFVTNEMAFRWVYRVNGQPTWATTLTPYKATAGNTVSPFATLGERA
jgi:HK97 family phage major capsid protein